MLATAVLATSLTAAVAPQVVLGVVDREPAAASAAWDPSPVATEGRGVDRTTPAASAGGRRR